MEYIRRLQMLNKPVRVSDSVHKTTNGRRDDPASVQDVLCPIGACLIRHHSLLFKSGGP